MRNIYLQTSLNAHIIYMFRGIQLVIDHCPIFILSIEDTVVLPIGIITLSISQLQDEISIDLNLLGLTFKEFCLNQVNKTLISVVRKFPMVSIVSPE